MRNTAVTIRVATPDDFEAASAVNRAAYAEYAAFMEPERIDRYLNNAGDVWSRQDAGDLLVAELNGEIVGSLTYYAPGPRSAAQRWPSEWAGLRLLAVAPSARGLGIGRLLMEASIERARSDGAPVIALHTTEMMEIARAMYERMGFVRAPEYDWVPSGGGRGAMAYTFDLRPSV